jgi:hypothetical protein
MADNEIFEPEKAKEAMVVLGRALKSMKDGPIRSEAISAYVQLIKSLDLAKPDNPIFIDVINRIERGEGV